MPARSPSIVIIQTPATEYQRLCLRHAHEYVTDAGVLASARCLDAGRQPSESVIREAQVNALTELVAGTMAGHAELVARLERKGPWSRIKAWWRR